MCIKTEYFVSSNIVGVNIFLVPFHPEGSGNCYLDEQSSITFIMQALILSQLLLSLVHLPNLSTTSGGKSLVAKALLMMFENSYEKRKKKKKKNKKLYITKTRYTLSPRLQITVGHCDRAFCGPM